MSLHGLKGRADDWAHGFEAAEKDTFIHLKSMTKIFGDRRAVWQKQTDFFALRQGKDQTVLDFAGTIKTTLGQSRGGPRHSIGRLFRRVEGIHCETSGNSRPQNL